MKNEPACATGGSPAPEGATKGRAVGAPRHWYADNEKASSCHLLDPGDFRGAGGWALRRACSRDREPVRRVPAALHRRAADRRERVRHGGRAGRACARPRSEACCGPWILIRTSLERRDYVNLQERQKGSYHGLGISVQTIDGDLTVVSPFEGTPAYRLGIRAGDIISKIEGEETRGMALDGAVKRLRGSKGSAVTISITRAGYDQPLDFTIVRDEIRLRSVPYSFNLEDGVGYIRLADFTETTASELEEALTTLKEQNARGLVLDLRDNPGGLLDQAVSVSNKFLDKGSLIVYTRGRTPGSDQEYIANRPSTHDTLPLVVLVSRGSASASEIVAGAIQDHDRGLIVGENTFGKGLVQSIYRISEGNGLALTTAKYYTPRRSEHTARLFRLLRRLLLLGSSARAAATSGRAQAHRCRARGFWRWRYCARYPRRLSAGTRAHLGAWQSPSHFRLLGLFCIQGWPHTGSRRSWRATGRDTH